MRNNYLKTQENTELFMEHIQDNFQKSCFPYLLNSPVDVKFVGVKGVLNFASLLVGIGLICKEKENDKYEVSDKLPKWLNKEKSLTALNNLCSLLVEHNVICNGLQRFRKGGNWAYNAHWLPAKLEGLLNNSNRNNKDDVELVCKGIVNVDIKKWENFLSKIDGVDFGTRCDWIRKLSGNSKNRLDVLPILGVFQIGEQYGTADEFLVKFLPILNFVSKQTSCAGKEEINYSKDIMFATKEKIEVIDPKKQFLQLFFSTVEDQNIKNKLISSILNMLRSEKYPKRFNDRAPVDMIKNLADYSEFKEAFDKVTKTKGEKDIKLQDIQAVEKQDNIKAKETIIELEENKFKKSESDSDSLCSSKKQKKIKEYKRSKKVKSSDRAKGQKTVCGEEKEKQFQNKKRKKSKVKNNVSTIYANKLNSHNNIDGINMNPHQMSCNFDSVYDSNNENIFNNSNCLTQNQQKNRECLGGK